MSYILDALNRSEEKRNGSSPIARDVSGTRSTDGKRRVIIILLLLILALSAGWMAATLIHQDQDVFSNNRVNKSENMQIMTLDTAPMTEPFAQADSATKVPAGSLESQIQDNRKQNATLPAQRDSKLAPTPTVNTLSPEQRRLLPEINIEGHIYDKNPAARMVIINGSVLRESQALNSELTLEEITPDGVLLNYHGSTFHMGTFD